MRIIRVFSIILSLLLTPIYFSGAEETIEAPQTNGLYVGVSGGYSMFSGSLVSGLVGYKVTEETRMDLAFDYIIGHKKNIDSRDRVKFSTALNFYYDFLVNRSPINPFIGMGGQYIEYQYKDSGELKTTHLVLPSLSLGISCNVASGLGLQVSYDNFTTASLGLRYLF